MNKFWKIYALIEDWLTGALLTIGVSLIFYGVIMRYIFSRPLDWVDEVSLYFVVWGVLLGTAVALRDDRHIRVSLLYGFLPVHVKRYFRMFSNAVGFFFCVFFVYYGIELEQVYLMTGQRSTNILIPLWIVYSAIPLTGVLLGVRFAEQTWDTIRQGGKPWMDRELEKKEEIEHGGSSSI